MTDEALTARELGIRSRAAVHARDRDALADLFADDAVVQDPIGPSPFDPEGKGHHGQRGHRRLLRHRHRAQRGHRHSRSSQSYLCGDEVADVGIIRTTLAGGTHQAVVRGVYTYRSNGAGKLASLRAFWEFDALELVELGGLSRCR